MKKFYFFLITLIALTGANQMIAQTYTLDLGSSFSPAWVAASTSGTANNIGGSGINCTIALALNGTGTIVAPYARVNNNNTNGSDFVVQGSTDAMEVDINLGNKTSYIDITYTFSAPIQNVNFAIADIDMPGGAAPFAYVDEVTVTGNGPAGIVTPTLTKYNTLNTIFNIAGNVATANTGAGGGNVGSLQLNNANQDGTMFVNFNGNAVSSITIRYNTLNAANVSNNPSLQAIAFGNISFAKAIPPVTANITVPLMGNANTATAITALSGTDDESIASFTIVTLPSVLSGILYYNNGVLNVPITVGQSLTPVQAASLKFDPLISFLGNATFTYTAKDNRGLVSNTSNYIIPIVSSSLPVKLTNFSATWNNNTTILSWTTAQEFNSDKFIVEKSSDAVNWQVLSMVTAAGNSNTASNYRTTDAQPFAISYYRLKQVDINGTYEYSKVLRMANKAKGNFSIRVFPNPVTNTATITTTSAENKTVYIKVYSNNGMLVKEIIRQLNAGTNNIDIPSVNVLTNGFYTVTMNDNENNKIGTVQFVKQ
jgi:Secretion system C-terminal sorting domain